MCVGLYARWGSGKTFMISLLKKEFDSDMRKDPRTQRLLQFFEKGYDELGSPRAEEEKISSLICGLLLAILQAFVPITMPYGMATFISITCEAFDAGAWCSKLKRSCYGKKTIIKTACDAFDAGDWGSKLKRSCCWKKTADSSDHEEDGGGSVRTPLVSNTEKPGPVSRWRTNLGGLCKRYRRPKTTKGKVYNAFSTEEAQKVITQEFIFVDFNAWECAACVHLSL